jgi:hypothetical protein
MPRAFGKTEVLSRDVIQAIKIYCWDSISEFYRRFKETLDMSPATFYRAIQGDICTIETYRSIMAVVDANNIGLDVKRMEDWDVRQIYVKDLLRKIDNLLNNFSPESLNDIKIFLHNHRGKLE